MSKQGNWIPLDKNLVVEFKTINRPYSRIEAMFSHTLDMDCGNEWSISGYARLWQWSRRQVRRFINDIHKSGHLPDRKRTGSGHPVSYINKELWDKPDRKRTGSGQEADTTNNPNNKKDMYITRARVDELRPEWFPEDKWEPFIKNRKFKKLQNTELALTTICNSFLKGIEAGFDIDDMVDEYIASRWTRFDHSWMKKSNGSGRRHEHDETRSRWARELLDAEPGSGRSEKVVNQIQGPKTRPA